MALEEYRRKRDFEKTPEPAPKPVAKKKAADLPHFYIQRHDATRLHYDFRLENDGVLVSWAVPKGPSLEPLSKHLAMHVEDHPLDYGTFEGNIPRGEYGGGSVMLWDQGTFEQLGEGSFKEQVARGDLKFRLHGEKINGEFALVHMRGRGKGNEWLLIKKKMKTPVPAGTSRITHTASLAGVRSRKSPKTYPPKRRPRKLRQRRQLKKKL